MRNNTINWDNAPDDFDFYIISGIAPEGNGFHKLSDCGTLYLDEKGFNFGVIDDELTVIKRPQIIPDNNVDALETQSHPIAPSVVENVTVSTTRCPIEQIKQLCSEHNVNIEISNKGEIYIHIENIDNTYKVCDMKQLTQVLDSVKLLESFKEG